jgi:hypothetical protein
VQEEYRVQLVPQLADPNQAAALAALCDKETSRTASARELIVQFRRRFMGAKLKECREALPRLLHCTSTLLRLCDGCLMEADFAPLPGDEMKLPEPMSLKRLRKQYRKLGLEVCVCVCVSVCRCVGVSVCRCVGVSVCRCVGVSVCRCVGVSVSVSVSVCLCVGVSACRCVCVLNEWLVCSLFDPLVWRACVRVYSRRRVTRRAT